MADPWDVLRTEEGRDQLITLADHYIRAEQDREAGLCLAELSYVVKHVGSPSADNAFAEAARIGAEAVALLRKANDKEGLCRALRLAAVPFLADCEPLLSESLSLARELGAVEQEAWTTFAMRSFGGGPDPMCERAHALFEQCGSLEGQAFCQRTMGFRIGSHDPEMLQRSIDLFEEAGNTEEAERGRAFLDAALMPEDPDSPKIPPEAIEELARMIVSGECGESECEPK
ncbi:MAG: hypothetical protein ABIV13_03795 [Fimbriimonadales bacterium]